MAVDGIMYNFYRNLISTAIAVYLLAPPVLLLDLFMGTLKNVAIRREIYHLNSLSRMKKETSDFFGTTRFYHWPTFLSRLLFSAVNFYLAGGEQHKNI